MSVHIPNEVGLEQALAGFEDGSGSAATPNFRLMGDLAINTSQPLSTRLEKTGSYVRRGSPKRQLPAHSGTYGEDMTFEGSPNVLRALIESGKTGVAVSGATGAYQYTKEPVLTHDELEAMTIQYGVDGLPFLATGVRFNNGNITIDVDDADGVWKFAGDLLVRGNGPLPGGFEGVATGGTDGTIVMTTAGWTIDQWEGAYVFLAFGSNTGPVGRVASNTADTLTLDSALAAAVEAGDTFRIEPLFTPGIALPDHEAIPSYGTKLFLDPGSGTIGTTQILDRVISTNVSFGINASTKRFLENTNEVSRRISRGETLVSGQIRVEMDRRDEWTQWQQLDELQLRIEQVGSMLHEGTGTRKRARIDVESLYWDDPTKDNRGENKTTTWGWVGFMHEPYVTYDFINALATLP